MFKVQVNDSEYGAGRAVIEARKWWNPATQELDWAVPAWEEMGLPELCGDFPTRAAAQAALDSMAEYLPEYGYTV